MWDIVEELVNMNVFPNPANPFAVNHAALRRALPDERQGQSGGTYKSSVGYLHSLSRMPIGC